jgi:hypothetical protein
MQVPSKLLFRIVRGRARLNRLSEEYGRGDRRVRAYDKKLQKLITEAQRGIAG